LRAGFLRKSASACNVKLNLKRILLFGIAIGFLALGWIAFRAGWNQHLVVGILGLALGTALAWSVISRRLTYERHLRQAIVEISNTLTGLPDQGRLLDQVVSLISALLPQCDKVVIHFLDEAGKRLYPRYASKPDQSQLLGMPANRGVAGTALKTLTTIVIPEVREAADFIPLRSGPELRSMMVAPLYVHGTRIGTISVNSSRRHAFKKRDQKTLTAIARQVSIVLHQMRCLTAAQQERRYDTVIIDALDDILLILDREQRLLRFNPSLARLVIGGVADLTGQILSITSQDTRIQHLAYIVGDLPTEECDTVERTVEIEEPFHALLHVTATRIADPDQEFLYVIIVHDQTEMQDHLQTLDKLMRAAACEIQEPATAIRGYASLLRSIAATKASHLLPWASGLLAQSADLLRLAGDLYQLSSLESLPTLEPVPLRLDEVVDQVAAELNPLLQQKNLSLGLDLPPHLPPVSLLEGPLRHMLRDLLHLAARRAPDGSHVHLSVEISLDEIAFSITDRGRPLSPEIRRRALALIFDRWFSELSGPLSTGLSFYVARTLADRLGGHLWIPKSTLEGTVFRLVVPIVG